MTEVWEPHSDKQEAALFSKHPITVAATGIQWGKTTIGALWLKMMMHTYTEPDDNFLITSPTYPILSQSTLPPFMRFMSGLGKLDKKDNCFRMRGGGTCWIRTGTHPDSIVGIPKVRAVLCDEAGKYSLYFWENIQARADPLAAPIMIVTSPYSLNWLYKEIILPKMKDKRARPDVNLIQAASIENPHFNKERYAEREKTMDPRRFKMMYGGGWERMAGLVYDCFSEEENQCPQITLPKGSRVVGGIDWGFTEPFVLKIRGITVEGFHFGIEEFYRSGLTIMDIQETVVRLCGIYNVEVIYAGPDRPENIEHLNRALHKAGLRARVIPADNSKRLGIDRHYELLKSRRLKYVRGKNPYTLDEIDTYHYPEPKDLKPDQDIKDQLPVEQNDHALDADRYISIMTYGGAKVHKPVVPDDLKDKQEDQFARIARLKRPVRTGGRSEDW